MSRYIFVLCIFFIVLISCTPSETAKEPKIYFCPKADCGMIMQKYVKASNESAYCALYDIDLEDLIGTFVDKSSVINVKIVVDNDNKLKINNSIIRYDDKRQLMHNKFCVFDGETIVTGSFNPTENDNYKNNNNIVIIKSKYLSRNYLDEFNELWNGKFGKGSNVRYKKIKINNITIENYFCPEDRCESKVIKLIKSSKSSIYFMAFSFTSEDIADALLKAKNAEIKGIFDESQSKNKYSQYRRLRDFGLNVKIDSNKYKLHHKVFIIDNETVVTGSFNPTLNADERNDENILIIHDKGIAERYLEEFEELWK